MFPYYFGFLASLLALLFSSPSSLPIINVEPLLKLRRGELSADDASVQAAAREIDRACVEDGFFYITGHGVDDAKQEAMERAAHEFFALPLAEKMRIDMRCAGKAWRGYFPVGAEKTSGVPDAKEGIYFGADDAADDARLMHGANQWPARPPQLRSLVEWYFAQMRALGGAVMAGAALGLGLDARYFDVNVTLGEPLCLFRIFAYPPVVDANGSSWSVGEHTDYGMLTLLRQDGERGGLQVRSMRTGQWRDVPPRDDALVCNIGDHLERVSGGRYHSTPHRVRYTVAADAADRRPRLSFPFFYDPSWHYSIRPLSPAAARAVGAHRWDGANVHALNGMSYGEYITSKVKKVFAELFNESSSSLEER